MSFQPGDTPWGTYDFDPEFQVDADRFVDYFRLKLGDPVLATHASSSMLYASFEESTLEYSAIVNQYQAKSVLAQFLGAQTGSLSGSENTFPSRLLEFQRRLSEPYSEAAKLNGTHTLYSASFNIVPGVAQYDLQAQLSQSVAAGTIPSSWFNPNQRIVMEKLYYFSPIQAYRFFGTTSAINYLNNQFSFESFTPETVFYLLPIWEDIMRGMQFKTSNNVRRSNYSYEIQNNVLTLYPCPVDQLLVYFTYYLPPDPTTPTSVADSNSFWGVSNMSNIPFGNIAYSKLNSISKQWIRRFALALAKEIEGQIRSKFSTVPIPNSDVTLNGPELIADGREAQRELREELKNMLDETTYQNLIKMEAELRAALEETWKGVPLGVYIGVYLPFLISAPYLLHALGIGHV
jgi:hypothetical protein